MLLAAATVQATPNRPVTKSYLLDERSIYRIAINRDAPTTFLFPGTIGALEGAGISGKAEEDPAVLFSYQSGTNFFSVRAMKPEAHAALNVVFKGRAFVLDLAADDTPDRTIRFVESNAPETSPEKLGALLLRAKLFGKERAIGPETQIAHARPGTVTRYRDFLVTVDDVFRFETEDVLICRLRITNTATTALAYDALSLAFQFGKTVVPAALVEGTGFVPPEAEATLYAAISGGDDGRRANLDVDGPIQVILSRDK